MYGDSSWGSPVQVETVITTRTQCYCRLYRHRDINHGPEIESQKHVTDVAKEQASVFYNTQESGHLLYVFSNLAVDMGHGSVGISHLWIWWWFFRSLFSVCWKGSCDNCINCADYLLFLSWRFFSLLVKTLFTYENNDWPLHIKLVLDL